MHYLGHIFVPGSFLNPTAKVGWYRFTFEALHWGSPTKLPQILS
jgi:hypothetical protein